MKSYRFGFAFLFVLLVVFTSLGCKAIPKMRRSAVVQFIEENKEFKLNEITTNLDYELQIDSIRKYLNESKRKNLCDIVKSYIDRFPPFFHDNFRIYKNRPLKEKGFSCELDKCYPLKFNNECRFEMAMISEWSDVVGLADSNELIKSLIKCDRFADNELTYKISFRIYFDLVFYLDPISNRSKSRVTVSTIPYLSKLYIHCKSCKPKAVDKDDVSFAKAFNEFERKYNFIFENFINSILIADKLMQVNNEKK